MVKRSTWDSGGAGGLTATDVAAAVVVEEEDVERSGLRRRDSSWRDGEATMEEEQ